MSQPQVHSRRRLLGMIASAMAGSAVLAACQQPRIVEKVVEREVEVTRVIEKEAVASVRPQQRDVTLNTDGRYAPYDWSYQVSYDYSARLDERILELWGKTKTHATQIVTSSQPPYSTQDVEKALSSGTLSDVVPIWVNTFVYWAEKGRVYRDITSNLRALSYDLADFVAHEWAYVYQRKYLGLPFGFGYRDWAANRTLIESSGTKVPDGSKWTWEELVEVGRQVTLPEKYRWGIDTQATWNALWTTVYSFGGELVSKDGTKTLLGQSPASDAIQMVYDWIGKWKVAPTPEVAGKQRLSFGGGEYAFGLHVVLGKEQFKAVQLLPPKHAGTGLRFSEGQPYPQAVTEAAATHNVVEEAVEFLTFLAGKEVQQLLADAGAFPARLSVFDSDLFAPQSTRQVLKESNKVRRTPGFELGARWDAWGNAVWQPLWQVFMGEVSLKEGLGKAVEAGDKALATTAGSSK